jgi:kumamolisin
MGRGEAKWGDMTGAAGNGFVTIPGSERGPLPAAQDAGPVDGSERIDVTIMTRRRAELPREYVHGLATLSREELAAGHGPPRGAPLRPPEVLARFGLEVTVADAGARRLTASGPASAFAAAFGASLRLVTSHDPAGGGAVTHRYREGSLHLPAELDGIVTAVIGLDNRPQAALHVVPAAAAATAAPAAAAPGAAAGAAASYTPPQIGALYQFPAGTDGTGQNISIIEWGGGYVQADLNTYFGGLGIAVPALAVVSVDGAVNNPGVNQSADSEVNLDIQVAGSLAPKASFRVYFAPNTAQGFIDGISSAVHANPAPTAISISWGNSEDTWSAQTKNAMDQQFQDACALGTTVFTVSMDSGAGDNVGDGRLHADFPASSPHVVGCGGTTQTGTTAAGAIAPETVWNTAGGGATGGGISDVYPVPAYQSWVTMPAGPGGIAGRGVPDVGGNADPGTGYQVRVNGQNTVLGGTSAVAPLWAALTARLAQGAGVKFGLLSTLLYAGVTGSQPAPGFQDVTNGNNNGYNAGPGWDACTGLGTPNGTALLSRLTPRMYVTTATANTVTVYTPGSAAPLKTIPVGGNPQCLVTDPTSTHLYVANHTDNTVSVISTNVAANAPAVTATIPVGGAPIGIAINPAGTQVYVGNNTSNTVSVISTATNTVTATIPVGWYPCDVCVNPAGALAYVANNGDSTVSVINLASGTVTATITGLPAARQTAFHPGGKLAYVTSSLGGASSVSVISTATNSVTATIPVGIGSFGVAVNPAGTVLYVANSGSNTVSVISTATNTVTATIPVGGNPLGLSLTADGTLLYVANFGDGSVSVISTATNTVTATQSGISGPRYVRHQ